MANQIVVSAGAKVRNLDGVLTGTSGVVNSLPINASNGIPQLDVNGKILVSQLPNSVMEYQGVWNANTNTPTLTNGGAFNQGDVYLCNVAGTTNFGAGPISFIVGDQAIYSGTIWQKAGGATGTVTSVAITESGDSLNITGSPITTSGTINIGFNGTNLQYVNGAGNLTTFPTLITSIGLSMPSAFSVANSPLTANGTIAVTGAGYASQYIRGDGTLADFPSSGGGGSSVSYYLNGGTSQGTIGGVTYYEMSKTADTGTGVDFTKSGDGFIVAFLTDANDPALLNIPAGNWNYEIYASMSANGGTPQMYAELYKYDGTTFTLISTSSNEILYDGTNLNLYTFGMTVPATSLTLTDRLAIKLYATNSGGKTTTVHTQDSHLCQVITTFSTGITALNGLTAQVQYFQTGTSGTDFNISSTTATHTFNIPDASATARGLITTGTQTIAGTKTFSDATKNNGGIFLQNGSTSSTTGYMNLGGTLNGFRFTNDLGITNSFNLPSATGYTFTFPNATGTIALTSDISYPVTSVFGRTGAVVATEGDYSLTQLSDVTITSPTTNQVLKYNGTAWVNDTDANTGTVTSVGLSAPTGFSVTGSPVTSSGTLALAFASGYSLPTTVKQSNWDDAYTFVAAFPTQTGNSGKYLTTDGSSLSWATNPLGTVTSVAMTVPTGLSVSGSPITTSGTLAVSLASGYSIPTTSSQATWDTAYSLRITTASLPLVLIGNLISMNQATALQNGFLTYTDFTTFNNKQGTITLTTTGTSGAATFSANTLNIPQYQGVLTNPVTGTGTTNYLPKFTSASTIGNSVIQEASSNIGIGVSPSYKLDVNGAAQFRDDIRFSTTNSSIGYTDAIRFVELGVSTRMTLSSGNLGLGVTPSAWFVVHKVMQLGGNFSGTAYAGAFTAQTNDNVINLFNNAYVNSSNVETYYASAEAAKYRINRNAHEWYNAPSGTAGNAITFTQAMTLTAAGRLLLGTTTESTYLLDVNGTGRFSGQLRAVGLRSEATSGYMLYMAPPTGDNIVLYDDASNTRYGFFNETDGRLDLMFSKATGAATFSSSVTAGGSGNEFVYKAASSNIGVVGNWVGYLYGYNTSSYNKGATIFESTDGNGRGKFHIALNNDANSTNVSIADAKLTILPSGAATFSSTVSLKGGLTIVRSNTIESSVIDNEGNLNYNARDNFNHVFKSNGTEIARINTTGAATFSSSCTATSFFESSDSRLKTLIQDNYQTKGIASITPKLYTKNGKVELGYYAQDFVGVLDSAVSKGSDDMLSLSYREVLVAKVYALEQEIKELKAKMN